MNNDEIKMVKEEFKKGAINAKSAGFDGVVLNVGLGMLLHQFLNDCSNKRLDNYGGSIENRCRFIIEIVTAL